MTRKRSSTIAAVPPPTAGGPVLSLRDLRTEFVTRTGTTTAVDGLSYDVRAGETVAIVGESGSGKSAHARSIIRLLPPAGRVVGGEVRYGGTDLLRLPEREMWRVRGREIGMVFQDPMTSLNPVLTIGRQITETIHVHEDVSRDAARRRAADLLARVRLPDPVGQLERYPHQLSGGMRQRVVLAMAVSCRPKVLLADEPTTALDVTVQAQILDLIAELSAENGMAVVLITHDLGMVARYADRVVVMYAGRAVEDAPTDGIFRRPAHPYARDLLRSRPSIDQDRRHRLSVIAGNPPDMRQVPQCCAYAPRCPNAAPKCRESVPPNEEVAPGRRAACWFAASFLDADARRNGTDGP